MAHGPDLSFEGQVALVTGASRGIGFQIAKDLARAGASLITTSRSASDGDRVAEVCGVEVRHVAVEFSDSDATREFGDYVRGLDRLDVCINNAGVARHSRHEEVTTEVWDETHDVNLKAPFFVSQAASSVMGRHGYGRIVNIGSIWSHITMEKRTVYTATKFGLRGFTLTMAAELAASGILVNMVAPGFTLTDMARENYSREQLDEMAKTVPAGRLGSVEDVSNVVLFFASRLNTYVTGQSVVVDGGYSIV